MMLAARQLYFGRVFADCRQLLARRQQYSRRYFKRLPILVHAKSPLIYWQEAILPPPAMQLGLSYRLYSA